MLLFIKTIMIFYIFRLELIRHHLKIGRTWVLFFLFCGATLFFFPSPGSFCCILRILFLSSQHSRLLEFHEQIGGWRERIQRAFLLLMFLTKNYAKKKKSFKVAISNGKGAFSSSETGFYLNNCSTSALLDAYDH